MCQCEEGMVQKLEQDFKLTLQQQSSLDQWASWLDNVVTQVLKHHEDSPSFPKAARQFLLKWSFYRYRSFFILEVYMYLLGTSKYLAAKLYFVHPQARLQKEKLSKVNILKPGSLKLGS